jgi:hypothetical protein
MDDAVEVTEATSQFGSRADNRLNSMAKANGFIILRPRFTLFSEPRTGIALFKGRLTVESKKRNDNMNVMD